MRSAGLIFSDDQALTSAGSSASTSVIDLGAAGWADQELWLVVSVGTAFTSSGAATLAGKLQTGATSTPTTDVAGYSFSTTALADLTAGKVLFAQKLPTGLSRYLRMYWTVGTTDFTGGGVNAYLTPVYPTNTVA